MPPALTAITSLSNIKNSQKSFVFSLHCALIRSVVLEEGGGGGEEGGGGEGCWVGLGTLRYKIYIGMRRCEGYGFQAA